MARDETAELEAEARIETALEDLAVEVARHCKGRTEVLEREIRGLAAILGKRDVAVVTSPAGEGVRTVVVAFSSADEAERGILDEAWARIDTKGRMITCLRNEAAPSRSHALDLRGFRDLVRPFGRTRIQSAQPFSWLLSVNEKGISIDRSMQRRIAVTVDLCRGPVLELGSGAGHLSAAIAERGMAARGIELAEGKVATARELYPHVDFEQGDILSMEPGSGSYGTVILAEVLEHVPEDVGRRMTDIAWSLVAPGGRLIVSVPNENLIPHRNHVREFTLSSFAGDLSRYGSVEPETRQPLRWLLVHVEKPA